jgi:aspartyl/asparaginyl-tRNA synthetase
MFRTDRESFAEGVPIEEANERRWTVECVDFLLPWAGETFGASQREEVHQTLVTKLRESLMFKQMVQIRQDYYTEQGGELAEKTPDQVEADAFCPFEPYLKLFENNKDVTRSGFGLGMGRLIQFLLGSTNVVSF